MGKSLVKIKYKTADGNEICVEVSTSVKELLEQSDRQIRSQRRQDRRYLVNEEYIDGLADTSTIYHDEDIADLVCRMDSYDRLHEAIETLPEVQRRRLRLYYDDNLTSRQIAALDGVHHTTIVRSLKSARMRLHKYLTK